MDSDVSADGDVDSESPPRNRSWKSSNSEQQSSVDANSSSSSSSDDESSLPPAKRVSNSSAESSPARKRASSHDSSPDMKAASSDRDSSPDPKNSDSDKESSPELKNGPDSDRDSSPDKVSNDSDRDSSPDRKTGNESDRESSPELKTKRSDRISSPDLKNTHESDRESSQELKTGASDRESSPEKHTRESDRESSLEAKTRGSDRDSSLERQVPHGSDLESSPEVKTRGSDRESSPEAKTRESDRESSPEMRTRGSDRESSPEAKTRVFDRGSSLESKTHGSDRDSSTEPKTHGSDRESSRERHTHGSDRESSPEQVTRGSDRDSSPETRTRTSDRDSSPDMKESYYNRKSSLESIKNRSRSTTITRSPENGTWSNSPENRSPVRLHSRSPSLDDVPMKENKRKSSDRSYENANGNISPKRSGSVYSESRSDLASSLDSVSPSQFEQQELKGEFNGDEGKDDEKISDTKKAIIDFADDLSDVSDIESNDSFEGQHEKVSEKVEEEEVKEDGVENAELPLVSDDKQEDAVSLHVEGEEQLDFEAEEGECSPKAESKKVVVEEEPPKEKPHSDLEEGELTDDNDTKPEETERPVCRFFSRGHCTWGSNCRFIHPGVMDKGNYSMFDTVRPIVTPGGPPPANPAAPMMYPGFPPHIIPPHLAPDRAGVVPPGGPLRKDEPPAESAWERGLRQAKEMIRKSSKRKETEVDFEDKKMNLTLSQDEIDKENDYYSRHSNSPPIKSPDLADKWKMEADAKAHRPDAYPNDLPAPAPHANPDVPPLGYYPPLHHGISRPDYWNPHRMGGLPYDDYALRAPHMPYGPDYYSGRRYMHPNSYYPPRPGGVPPPPSHHPDFYDRKQKHKPYPGSSREVIVQKNDKPYKDDRYRGRREESPRVERARDDEWADPWMRTKSPASGRRRRRRKNTYSSGSSYSSSSDSGRSSSRSSVSSRSRQSRSKARSSGSRSHSSSRSATESQARRKPPMQFKLSPSSRQQLPTSKKNPKAISPTLLMERRAATERAMHMNPPPPSPKIKTRPHSPPQGGAVIAVSQPSPARAKVGLPERLLAHSKAAVAAAMRSTRSSESRSSKSSSGSSSSDSSSESSDSSASSSSSSKSSKTPPVRAPKRTIPDDHMAVSQTVKAKAMDALKLSGQKQQIKLTLKGSGNNASQSKRAAVPDVDNRKDRQQLAGKKRVVESSDSGSDSDAPSKKTAKLNTKRGAPPSRREELLKQLRAVEDAIARKRSKNL